MVADALSRKTLHMSAMIIKELELIEKFKDMSLVCEVTPQSVMLGTLKINNEGEEDYEVPGELAKLLQ